MIRRKAVVIDANQPAFVLGWMLKVGADKSEVMQVAVELVADGAVYIMPIEQVKFADGSPEVIPVIA